MHERILGRTVISRDWPRAARLITFLEDYSVVKRIVAIAAGVVSCDRAAAVPLWAVFRVAPAVVEATFENGRISGSFTVTNSDAKAVRLRVFPVHFHLTLDGQVTMIPVDSTSLSPWIKITPREFPLEPNSERQVRYAVMAPDTVPDGTYWGGLEFLPLPTHQDSLESRRRSRRWLR